MLRFSRAPVVLPLIALLIAYLVLRNLGAGSLDLWDESFTAGRSLSMLHDWDLFSLMLNGSPSMRKPPLIYVLNAASMSLLGTNELGLRLPNALLGLGVFALTGLIAARHYGRDWIVAALLLLLGSPLFLEYCREALTDTLFVFGLLLAVCGLLEMARAGRAALASQLVFAAGLAIALLGKNLLALLLPAYAFTFFLLLRQVRLAWALVVPTIAALLPLLAWIVGAAQVHPDFFQVFFQQEYLNRMGKTDYLPLQVHGPLWYLKKMVEWFSLNGYAALALSVWFGLAQRRLSALPTLPAGERRVTLFLAGFALAFLLLLTLASHKRDAYTLPLFPLWSLMLIGAWRAWRDSRQTQHARTRVAQVGVAVVLLGVLHTLVVSHPVPDYKPMEKALALALRPLAAPGVQVVSDSGGAARILHFYLDRTIIVAPLDEVRDPAAIVVSEQPIPGGHQVGKFHYRVGVPAAAKP